MDLLPVLLQACRDNPDDDLPRRVLGDWLLDQPDESAQARGEFIHAQLNRASGPRADELLAAHRHGWLGPLVALNPWFVRGLVELRVNAVNADAFVRLLNAPPPSHWGWVTGLVLRGPEPRQLARLFEWQGLSTVGHLQVHNAMCGSWAAGLVRSPHFRAAALHLHRCTGEVRSLGQLTVPALCIRACNLTDADLAAWRDAPLMMNLRRLSLPDNRLTAEGAAALADCPAMGHLRVLDLGRNVIGAEGAKSLGHATAFGGLEELDLRLNGIRDQGAMALLRSPLGRRLRRVNLVSNGVLSPDVQRLWRDRLGGAVEF